MVLRQKSTPRIIKRSNGENNGSATGSKQESVIAIEFSSNKVGSASVVLQQMIFKLIAKYAYWVGAIGVISTGAFLVVRGETLTVEQDASFTKEQQALRRAFEVFPDGSQNQNQSSTIGNERKSIALLAIPSIDISVVVVDYYKYDDLETAVGRMRNSASLGSSGSSVIVGHRTGFGSPFLELDEIKIGDQLQITQRTGEVLTFIVTRQDIVAPSIDLSIYDNTANLPQVILVTCHPEYSTDERLVIVAELPASEEVST